MWLGVVVIVGSCPQAFNANDFVEETVWLVVLGNCIVELALPVNIFGHFCNVLWITYRERLLNPLMISKCVHPKLHFLWCKKIVHFAHSCKRSFLCCLFLAFYDSDVACEGTFKSCFYVSYILIKLATKMYDLATIFFPFVTGRLL